MILRLFATIIFLSFLSQLTACTTPVEVTTHETAIEDSDYYKQYEQATHKAEVFHNFESKYKVTVTYLSSSFKKSLTKRMQKLYSQKNSPLSDSDNKIAFFISLQAPRGISDDLTDSKLWTLLLDKEGQSYEPILIKPLHTKERWIPFFQDVNLWTKEFFIMFDVSANNSQDLVNKEKITLTLSNSSAKTSMTW